MNGNDAVGSGAARGPVLRVSTGASNPTPDSAVVHDVFKSADLLVRLLLGEIDIGYKLVSFYTACATLYIAIVGLTAQQYFVALSTSLPRARAIAWFGFFVAVVSLSAPFGLRACRAEIEGRATRYAAALGLPPERFTVVRFGTWLSLAVFGVVAAGWAYLVWIVS